MASIEKTKGDGGKGYRVRWRDPDGRARSRRCATKEAARELLRQVERCADLGIRWDPADLVPPERPPDLWQLVDAYLVEETHKRAPRTLVRKRQMLQAWLEWLQRDLGRTPQAADLTREMLLRYLEEELAHPKKGRHLHGRTYTTQRKHVQEIEICWKRLWTADAADLVPRPQSLELPARFPAERPAPTWAQMDAVISASSGWQRAPPSLLGTPR